MKTTTYPLEHGMLYSLEQLAHYCGKSYETLRLYYTFDGFLPDPKHTIKYPRKTTRRFTLEEMEEIKIILDSVEKGDLAHYTRPRRTPKGTDTSTDADA